MKYCKVLEIKLNNLKRNKMEILGGICIGYFLHPYINVTIKIIKNSFNK